MAYISPENLIMIGGMILASLFGAIVGGMITFLTTYALEKKKEKKEDKERLYAPLYYEIRELFFKICKFSDYYPCLAWHKIKDNNLRYCIKPTELRRNLNSLYGEQLHNFMIGRNAAIKTIQDLLNKELNISKNKEQREFYIERLSHYLLSRSCQDNFDYLHQDFSSFNESLEKKFASFSELESYLRPKIRDIEMVKHVKNKRRKLMRNIHQIEMDLENKLRIKPKKYPLF